ncbi:MAG: hypothetical protein CM1200mP34_2570 [Verrucomicrobiales bacterium]|nr:MAG: hypothetical protein CM1200mP34_2570 [Verrucomicrobiales bacterium]
MARTISVLARPGTPVIRQLPPAKSVMRISSTAAFCPMMTRPSSFFHFLAAGSNLLDRLPVLLVCGFGIFHI